MSPLAHLDHAGHVHPGTRATCHACKRPERIRSSGAWQRARAQARARDGNQCTRCSATTKLGVHHLRSLASGGTNDLANLTTLCASCHARIEHAPAFFEMKTPGYIPRLVSDGFRGG